MAATTIVPLRTFVVAMTRLVNDIADESTLLIEGGRLMKILVGNDSWLPDSFATPSPDAYQQFLLHADPLERFSVISFVWGPGQRTPIHDHCTWGIIGMLRGAEKSQKYKFDESGKFVVDSIETLLQPGDVEAVGPTVGDIHIVSNAFDNQASVSIHVYGANLAAVSRHMYHPETGEKKPFVSHYTSEYLPNLWDRSAEIRAQIH